MRFLWRIRVVPFTVLAASAYKVWKSRYLCNGSFIYSTVLPLTFRCTSWVSLWRLMLNHIHCRTLKALWVKNWQFNIFIRNSSHWNLLFFNRRTFCSWLLCESCIIIIDNNLVSDRTLALIHLDHTNFIFRVNLKLGVVLWSTSLSLYDSLSYFRTFWLWFWIRFFSFRRTLFNWFSSFDQLLCRNLNNFFFLQS